MQANAKSIVSNPAVAQTNHEDAAVSDHYIRIPM
jgi:hypothetical protein